MDPSRLTPTTSSWGIMWTGGSKVWRPFACYWPTRSNILRISSSSEETMNVPVLIGSTASLMNVSANALAKFT